MLESSRSTFSDPAISAGKTGRIFGLDVLRSAAILAVTLAHTFAVLYPHVSWLGLFGHGGFYGVELFFVLSGFLIGQILIRHGPELGQGAALPRFYVRRWFRTLPLFWLLLAANVALDRWQANVHYAASDVLAHAFFLRNFSAPHLGFVPESWSLAVEEWFYLLFPAALWLGLRVKGRFNTVFLTAAAAFYIFSTAGRILSASQPQATWGEWQRTVVIYRFDALMAGILAAWVAHEFPAAWRRWTWTCAVAGLLLVVGMYLTLWRIEGNWVASAADSFFARTWRFNLVSLGFALLLPAAAQWKIATENFGTRAVRCLALWSYGIYLVQHPLARFIMPRFFTDWQASATHAWALFATLLVAFIGVAAVLHYAFEAPVTRLRERFAPAREKH